MSVSPDLPAIYSFIQQGASKRGESSRLIYLALSDQNMQPSVRLLVNRGLDVEARTLYMHTDLRAPKVNLINQNPQAEALIYDKAAKVQIRLTGNITVHHNDNETIAKWQQMHKISQLCYFTKYAPSSVLAYADFKEHQAENKKNIDELIKAGEGVKNMAILKLHFNKIDYLYLDNAGHQRVRFNLLTPEPAAEQLHP